MHTGKCPDIIDHIDQDKSNDRFENLRSVSSSRNIHNSDLVKGSVPYRGVSYSKAHQKFKSAIKVNGKFNHLGYFTSAEEAHYVYQKAKEELCLVAPS